MAQPRKKEALNINDERAVRVKKMEDLRADGIETYPAHAERTHTIVEAFGEQAGADLTIFGRVVSKREMGKLCFAHIQDASGKIQAVLKQDQIEKETFKRFVKKIDIADFVQISGERFVTQKGEESILVSEWKLLTKALLPLPDQHYGLKDEETRLRKRYLDILAHPELRERFVRKSVFWNSMRHFLVNEGFLEVETPVLEATPGGADASPFVTHHNALDMEVFLRISMGELWQKRLMVAGFEKTFEIGRQFRNEGMSREHLQDYTQMEFYWGYADYTKGMELTERMYKHVIQETFGTLKFTIGQFKNIDLAKPWERIDYVTEIESQLKINVLTAGEDAMRAKLSDLGVKTEEHEGRGRLMDSLWKQCRKQIKGPVFLTNIPVAVSPLAKRLPSNPELTERFQIVIAGSELGNGYSELNDPIDQAGRFEEQAKMREAGDDEAQFHDKDFVEALEHGMPPTCGFGVSERLFSFLEDSPIRECVLFPLMRPDHMAANESGKARNAMVAQVVILNDPKRESWTRMNAIAHLTAAFGARDGKRLFQFQQSETKDGVALPMNIQHAIMIRETDSMEALRELKAAAEKKEFHVECFTQAMQDTTNDDKVDAMHKESNFDDLEILGVLVYGERKAVEKLTKSFPLAS